MNDEITKIYQSHPYVTTNRDGAIRIARTISEDNLTYNWYETREEVINRHPTKKEVFLVLLKHPEIRPMFGSWCRPTPYFENNE